MKRKHFTSIYLIRQKMCANILYLRVKSGISQLFGRSNDLHSKSQYVEVRLLHKSFRFKDVDILKVSLFQNEILMSKIFKL